MHCNKIQTPYHGLYHLFYTYLMVTLLLPSLLIMFQPYCFSIFVWIFQADSYLRFSKAWLRIFSSLRTQLKCSPLKEADVCLKSSYSVSLNFNHSLSCLIFFITFSTTWNYLIFTCLFSIPLLTPNRMWFHDGRAVGPVSCCVVTV